MKTRELVRLLREADPSGDMDVVAADNSDIHFVEVQPAYHDGLGQALARDEECNFYNVTGGRFLVSGHKVRLHALSIRDAIRDRPDMPVDLSEIEKDTPYDLDRHEKQIERWRRESRRANEDFGPGGSDDDADGA
jgi:hypothetical protein